MISEQSLLFVRRRDISCKIKNWLSYRYVCLQPLDWEIGKTMPDESCRKCGGPLVQCTKCAECRDTITEICIKCGQITKERFHATCFYFVEKETFLQEEPLYAWLQKAKSGFHPTCRCSMLIMLLFTRYSTALRNSASETWPLDHQSATFRIHAGISDVTCFPAE